MNLKTLDKALTVLQHFTKETPSWGLRELAREANMNHTIVYRILSTFEKHGYMHKNEATQKYALGLKFMEHSSTIEDQLNISDLILPIMGQLTEDTGESTVLTWLDGLEGIYLEIAQSTKQVKFAHSLGVRSPLYIGATHKTIMAYLPQDKQQEIIAQGLKRQTDYTIIDESKLWEDLKTIQQQNWCYSRGEFFEDVAALAAPLFDYRDCVTGSLAIAGPKYRLSHEKAQQFLPLLQKARMDIQRFLSNIRTKKQVAPSVKHVRT